MRLVSLEFHDKTNGWQLEKMTFEKDITLLLGASGVGKSKILSMFQFLEKSVWAEYKFNFHYFVVNSCEWTVECEVEDFLFGRKEISINRDSLCSGKFNSGEVTLSTLIRSFGGIETHQYSSPSFDEYRVCKYLHQSLQAQTTITSAFVEIFPFVEGFSMTSNYDDFDNAHIHWRLIMQERNVSAQLHYSQWSKQMQNVFCLLVKIFSMRENSVLVMDDFANCSSSYVCSTLWETVSNICAEKNIQIVFTTHHPYLIEKVHQESWRVVTRRGSCIRTHTAQELAIGKTKHRKFTELINTDEYRIGIFPS